MNDHKTVFRQWIAIGMSFVGIVGTILAAGVFIGQALEKIGILERKIEKIEESPASDNSQLMSKVAQHEKQLSEVPSAYNRIASIESKIEQMGRSIEARLTNTDEGPNTKNIESLSELYERLNILEKRIEKINSSRTNSLSKVELKSDYQSSFPTKVVGSLEISLRGCQKRSTQVTCKFIFNNTKNTELTTRVYSSHETSAILSSGLRLYGSKVAIGEESYSGNIVYTFPNNIPTPLHLIFENVSNNSIGFLRLYLNSNEGRVQFDKILFES